jgi:hypothetical protein
MQDWKHPPKDPPIIYRFSEGIYTYTLEKIRCGKPQCRSCPHPAKGGYWYVAWSVRGRIQRRYIGKKLKLISTPTIVPTDLLNSTQEPEL